MNTHRQSVNVLRRPTMVMLVVLAVTLSGCMGSDWFSEPGLAPQTATIHGTVYEGDLDGPVVADAAVSAGGVTVVTGPDGTYSLRDVVVDGNVVTLAVEAPGYEPRTMQVAVEAGTAVIVDVSLSLLEEEPGDGGNDQQPAEEDEEEPSEEPGEEPVEEPDEEEEEPAAPEYEGMVAVSVRLRNAPTTRAVSAEPAPSGDIRSVGTPAPVRRTAVETYVPGEWIVELDHSSPVRAVNAQWADAGVRVVEQLADNYYLVVTDEQASDDDIEQRLLEMPNVVSVGRNQRVHPVSVAVTPNDEYYSRQWGLPLISAPHAWSLTTGSQDVVVAVLDTGLRADHPDIDRHRLVPGRNFVSDQSATNYTDNIRNMSHGTMVAGIIGASTNNSTGVAGLNWSVSIMPVRVLSSSGGGTVAGVGQGIRWAVDNGADVINMSLAWDANSGDPGERFVVEQIEYAISRGVTLVAGAGNDNGRITMPAAHPDVIAVGAVDRNKQRAWYSNYGSQLDVVAPGGSQSSGSSTGGVLSTDVVSGRLSYSYQQGTSFASPHVAGVVALMYSNGITDPHQIREILADTAEDLGTRGFDTRYGYGLINAYAAVAGITREDALVGVAETDGTVRGPVHPQPAGEERVAVVEGVAPGRQAVFAWIDVTNNGMLDEGDFAGVTDVVVPETGTVDVDLDLFVFETLSSADQQRLLQIVNQ